MKARADNENIPMHTSLTAKVSITPHPFKIRYITAKTIGPDPQTTKPRSKKSKAAKSAPRVMQTGIGNVCRRELVKSAKGIIRRALCVVDRVHRLYTTHRLVEINQNRTHNMPSFEYVLGKLYHTFVPFAIVL